MIQFQLHRRTVIVVVATFLAFAAVATTSLVLTLTRAAEANHKFNDIADGTFFHEPTAWLSDNGIADGFPDGSFRPNANITRGQAAYWFSNYDDLPTDAATLGGILPSGFVQSGSSAGGDLNGTYPNPGVAPNVIGGQEVANRSLRLADVSVANSAQTGINLPSIAAHSCVDTTVTVGGVLNTDVVLVTPPPTLPAGVIVGTRKPSSNGQIVVRACNVASTASANPANAAMSFAVFR